MYNSSEHYIKKIQRLIDYRNKLYFPDVVEKMKRKIKEIKKPHLKEMWWLNSILGGVPILFSITYFLVWFFTDHWKIGDYFICGVPFFLGVCAYVWLYIRYRNHWRKSLYLEDVNYLDSLILQYNKEKNK